MTCPLARPLSEPAERSLALAACVLVTAGTVAIPSAGAQAPVPRDIDMPIEAITLYRSGVGGFVRSAVVDGDATARLTFETEQINDILKSMTVLDFGGGTVGAIAYAADEPLARRLESFGLDISDQPSTADIFTRIRGTDVRLETADGPVVGTVLGIETRMAALPGIDHAQSQTFVNLVTPSSIQSLRVNDVRRFEILDDQLAAELRQALGALAQHRAERSKAVELELLGNAGRDRTVGVYYVHEMPVWKMTYRLVLADAEETEDERTTLQGFAIVENTTDADWHNVRLSLAAGRPVSFTMDLYEPVFLERPDVPPPMLAAVGPQMYAAGLTPQQVIARNRTGLLRFGASVNADTDAEAMHADRAGELLSTRHSSLERQHQWSGITSDALGQAAATTNQQGEQFFLTLDQPVSLERRQSAMLPVIVDEIAAERLSIYSRANGRHPMRGARITNTAELTLLPGPIAVYDGPAYAGDAVIPHVTAGAEQLLSYAVDIDVLAEVEAAPHTEVQRVRIVDGLLETTRSTVQTTTYTFTNRDRERGRDLIVEHRPQPGFELESPSHPDEAADGVLRFRLEIAAGEGESLEVVERVVRSDTAALLSVSEPYLAGLRHGGKLSERVLEAFREASRLRARVDDAQRELNALTQQRRDITGDQDRIRENLAALDRDSRLYTRYVRTLDEQEDRLERIAGEQDRWRKEKAERDAALRDYLRDLIVS